MQLNDVCFMSLLLCQFLSLPQSLLQFLFHVSSFSAPTVSQFVSGSGNICRISRMHTIARFPVQFWLRIFVARHPYCSLSRIPLSHDYNLIKKQKIKNKAPIQIKKYKTKLIKLDTCMESICSALVPLGYTKNWQKCYMHI